MGTGARDPAGIRLVPEPSRAMTALVAGLLSPTTLTLDMQRDEVRGRLLGLLRHLLAARRITVLQWEHEQRSYTVWRDDAAGVEGALPGAIVAKCSRLREHRRGAIDHAAVDDVRLRRRIWR